MSGVIANISMPYDQRTSLDLMKYEFQCLWYAAHYEALRRSFGQDRCNKFLHSTALPPLGFCGIFPVDSLKMLPWWSYICPGKIYEKFASFQHTSIIYMLAFKMIYFTLFSEPKHPMSTWIHCIHTFSQPIGWKVVIVVATFFHNKATLCWQSSIFFFVCFFQFKWLTKYSSVDILCQRVFEYGAWEDWGVSHWNNLHPSYASST